MKALTTVIQAILLLIVAASLVTAAVPWAIQNFDLSVDITEIKTIKSQFDTCSDRIIETARTGSTNKCIFNIKNGQITGRTQGVYYSLASNGHICDSSPLVEMDSKNHIWQECNVSGSTYVFGMLWMFPKELNITGTGVQGSMIQGESSSGSIGFGSVIEFNTISVVIVFTITIPTLSHDWI